MGASCGATLNPGAHERARVQQTTRRCSQTQLVPETGHRISNPSGLPWCRADLSDPNRHKELLGGIIARIVAVRPFPRDVDKFVQLHSGVRLGRGKTNPQQVRKE